MVNKHLFPMRVLFEGLVVLFLRWYGLELSWRLVNKKSVLVTFKTMHCPVLSYLNI